MKKTALAALLALCLCAPLPAQAADWTNGTVSCDVVDIVLADSTLFWLWGKWEKYNVKFYLTAKPATSVTFGCGATNTNNTLFSCSVNTSIAYDYDVFGYLSVIKRYTVNPGTPKSTVCADVFTGHEIRVK